MLRGTYDGLSLAVQTAEVPVRSLDESSALPDTCPAVEKTRSATADSRCDPIKDRTRETQGASAPQAVDSEMSSAGSDNCPGEAAPQNSLFPRSTAPRRRRHAHEHLVAATKPRYLRLEARFNVRGGIHTSVVAEHRKLRAVISQLS